jgi:excinuclease ABC subunit B
MQEAIDETNRRRTVQMEYNEKHGIVPVTILKSKESILGQTKVADSKKEQKNYYIPEEEPSVAADPVVNYMSKQDLEKLVERTKKQMERAAKDLDFMEAAKLRDEYFALKKLLEEKHS